MSIAAQLAQGCKIYIAGAAGASEALTAIVCGYPTILAMTGHAGIANGDVVTFDSNFAGGDDALINGQTAVAHHVATGAVNDTFAVDINTAGKTITIGTAHATPADWTQIKEIKSIKPAGAQASKIDVTDLDSLAKEFESGLIDNGTVAMEYFEKVSDPGQQAALAAFVGSVVCAFKVVLTGGSIRTFSGSILKFGTLPDAAVDGVQTGSFEIQISGAVTRS
jgi:hypothetical protein